MKLWIACVGLAAAAALAASGQAQACGCADKTQCEQGSKEGCACGKEGCGKMKGKHHGGMHGKHKPCHEDAARLCNDLKPGPQEMLACLKAHETELSSECKLVLPEIEKIHQEK